MKVSVQFRADNATEGRILTFISNQEPTPTYFTLKLKNGRVISNKVSTCTSTYCKMSFKVTANYGTSKFVYNIEIDSPSLCDNGWHKVQINFEIDKLKWALDNFDEVLSDINPNDHGDFMNWNGDAYVGKVSGLYILYILLLPYSFVSSESFLRKGTLREGLIFSI